MPPGEPWRGWGGLLPLPVVCAGFPLADVLVEEVLLLFFGDWLVGCCSCLEELSCLVQRHCGFPAIAAVVECVGVRRVEWIATMLACDVFIDDCAV